MNRNLSLALGILLTFCFYVGAQEGKYADLKDFLIDYIEATEDLAIAVEQAEQSEQIANALNIYVDAMTEFMPAMETFQKKYPELDDKVPEELTDTMAEFSAAMGSFAGMTQKLMQYMEDEAVQKAMERFQTLQ